MRVTHFMPRFAWLVGALGTAAILVVALRMHQPREPHGSMALLDELLAERVPHPVNTEAGAAHARRVAAMLESALAPAKVKVELQETTVAGPRGAPLPLVNVLARLPGRERGAATLVTAHHDSVPAGPGAGDDGTGVVTVLEIAASLAKEGTNRDVIFLLTDGEEVGLWGAIAFCAEHPWFDDVGAVVNLDGRGAAGPCAIFEVGHDQRALVDRMRRSVPRPVSSSLADRIYSLMPNGTDFTVYRRVGLPGYNLAFIGDVHRYHQPEDLPENVHPGTLGHMQETALALVHALDRSPPIPTGRSPTLSEWRSRSSIGDPTAMDELRKADLGTAPDPTPQSFHAFLGGFILSWDMSLSPWLAGAAMFALLVALTVAWMRGLLGCGALLGALGRVLLVVLVVACVLTVAANGAAMYGRNPDSDWHRVTGGLWPIPAWPWLASVWALGCAVMCAWWQLVPRRDAWANVSAGTLVLGGVLGVGAILEPSTAAMTLPIIGAVAIVMLLASLLPRRAAGIGAAIVGCVQVWGVAFALAPMEPLLQEALGWGIPPVVIIVPILVLTAFVVLLPGAGDRPLADTERIAASSPLEPLAPFAHSPLAPVLRSHPGLASAPLAPIPLAPSALASPAQIAATPEVDEQEWRPR